jgi:hypothetical protein
MPYLALDDNFAHSPKVTRLTDRAFRLHVVALCHCSQHLTDGFISESAQIWAEIGTTKKINAQLVKSGLWEIVEGGWQIHDYLDWNASAAQIKEKRRRDRQRKRSKSLNDSEWNPDRNGDTFHADSAGSAPRERPKGRSLSGEPAKSVRLRRAKPEGPAEPAPEPTSHIDLELPPPDERQRIAAELRAQLLGDQAAQRRAKAAAAGSSNGLPAELQPTPDRDPDLPAELQEPT